MSYEFYEFINLVSNSPSDPHPLILQLAYVCKNPYTSATSYPASYSPSSMTLGYSRNDTKLDLIVVNAYNDTINVLLGYGNRTFESPMNYSVGQYPGSVISGDFNNDNK